MENYLFAVVLGGRADGCNTELHDTVFVVGESIEQLYPSLVNKWFGNTYRLHLDSWIKLTSVDGYDITVSNQPNDLDVSLYFVNFGGYRDDYFGELHETAFYVGDSAEAVRKRAHQELLTTANSQHRDDILLIDSKVTDTRENREVDDIFAVSRVDNYFVNLRLTDTNPDKSILDPRESDSITRDTNSNQHESKSQALKIVNTYTKLDKPDILIKANEMKLQAASN